MSNIPDVIAGVTEALAESGEALTIRRTVETTDPNNPTQPPTTTNEDYTCVGYVGPVSQWNSESMQREVTTQCYIDPLSLVKVSDDSVPNTASDLTFVTQEGDIVIDGSGKQWRLTVEQHPRIEGRVALFWHTGLA